MSIVPSALGVDIARSYRGRQDRDRAARLRLDLAGTFTAGQAKSTRVDSFALGPGLALDLGAQLGDHAAVYVRGEASTIFPFTFQAAGYVIGEWTPVRRFSIGSGLGYEMMLSYCQGCTSLEPNPNWAGVSFPLILGLNIGAIAPARATRTFLRIGSKEPWATRPARTRSAGTRR
jgi:hypothetical protein